jgi:hypothetical protein
MDGPMVSRQTTSRLTPPHCTPVEFARHRYQNVPKERQVHAQLRRVVAHVADQASVRRQFRRQFVGRGDVSDVAGGQGKAEQSPLTICNPVDFGRSAATGAANRLFACTTFATGG